MIKSIKARNFLSWADLDLTLESGVTLIDGFNEDDQTPEGSGKSAILNAICWALFGKIPKETNIDDVIKEGEKSCSAEVHFDDCTIVRRTRGPNDLVLICPGVKDTKGKDARETQKNIENYLGLTFETFCQTIYFAQNYTKKFVTANQEEKGKILSEVQDLVIFDKAGKEVRSLAKMEEDSLVKLKHSRDVAQKDIELTERDIQAEILKHEHAREQQVQRIQNIGIKIQAEQARIDREKLRQAEDVANVARRIEDVKKSIIEIEGSKLRLLESVKLLQYDEPREKVLKELNNQLMAQMGAVSAELTGIDRLASKKIAAEAQGKRYATRYQQVVTEIDKTRAFIANPSKDCPTCGTKLQGCDTHSAQTELVRLEQEQAEILEMLTQLAAEIDSPVPTKDELNAKLVELRQQRMANDSEINNLHAVRDQMNRAAAHLTDFDQNIKRFQEQLLRLEQEYAAQSAPREINTAQLEALQAQLETESAPLIIDQTSLDLLRNKLCALNDSASDVDNLIGEKNIYLSRLEKLKNGFKETKSYVFNAVLNEINARVQKYLSHLFEVPVVVRFTNNDMKIETYTRYDGVERVLGLLSGGQFRRVNLAVDLALSDTITARKGARVGITVWDEYMKDLSESSMEKVLRLFEARQQPVILIEHNSTFKSIVTNSIHVKLENGTSRVVSNV